MKIDHIGIAVKSLAAAVKTYEDTAKWLKSHLSAFNRKTEEGRAGLRPLLLHR